MSDLVFFDKFYLDKEKDIIVNLYNLEDDEMTYILETPNHNTGNLITNLAKICGVKTTKNENDMKIITGKIPASINGDNEEVYIFRLGGIKIANIYANGKIEVKVTIPAISKTLMSQTKDYKLDINKTIVKSYILKNSKFRTDLHTHMNANLTPDVLIALGIKHQIRYPLYYIKKLNLRMTRKQEKIIYKQREEVEKRFQNSELKGKYLIRRVDDNTFINFADFILNNLENAEYNIAKIRTSLSILKDGQAVFTNLEKLYLYRYVFCRGIEYKTKIDLNQEKIERIPERDIKNIVRKMIKDMEENSKYKNNTLFQDKLLWIAREYQKQGIKYTEIADTNLVKYGEPAIKLLEEVHDVMPKIEKETGVAIRFLVAIRRIPLTIIKDQKTSNNYLRENLDILKAVAKDPYVVGSDFIGEEINDISELRPVIEELVQYTVTEDPDFTIRIHAGENDSLRDNVAKSIECVKQSLKQGQKMPRVRLGHGLYTADLNSPEGKKLIKNMQETGVVLEFQLTSNVRLNNLNSLDRHPLKTYLKNNIKCVQGTDGCGFYGVDTIDEQLALRNLLELDDDDFEKMRQTEKEILEHRERYFIEKSKKFEKLLNGRTLRETILNLEDENIEKNSNNAIKMRINNKLDSKTELKGKIKSLPTNKIPIVIAGGSFNAIDRNTKLTKEGKEILVELIKKVNSEKAYFVIGHKMEGYEKAIIDIAKELDKNIEIDAIIPKEVSKEIKENLTNKYLNGVCISTESEEMGIYKSFNYEIFERRNSVVVAFDGNSAVANLVQEAKNGKGKARIYVNEETPALQEKAKSLHGYVIPFNIRQNIVDRILEENPEIADANNFGNNMNKKIDL
ncbi:MAG: adenosine deaminase [Clostridia bacterium]|nr:adenosine deaminase [Clostridia bacterium]